MNKRFFMRTSILLGGLLVGSSMAVAQQLTNTTSLSPERCAELRVKLSQSTDTAGYPSVLATYRAGCTSSVVVPSTNNAVMPTITDRCAALRGELDTYLKMGKREEYVKAKREYEYCLKQSPAMEPKFPPSKDTSTLTLEQQAACESYKLRAQNYTNTQALTYEQVLELAREHCASPQSPLREYCALIKTEMLKRAPDSYELKIVREEYEQRCVQKGDKFVRESNCKTLLRQYRDPTLPSDRSSLEEIQKCEREEKKALRTGKRLPSFSSLSKSIGESPFTALQQIFAEPYVMQSLIARFTLSGPVTSSAVPVDQYLLHLAVDPSGPLYYGVTSSGVFQVSADGKTSALTLDPVLDEEGWMTGATFDEKRKRLIVATLSGEGHLYSYEPATRKWTQMTSLQNEDMSGIAYIPEKDTLFAISTARDERGDSHYGSELHVFTPEGKQMRVLRLSRRIPVDIPLRSIQLISVRGSLVALSQTERRDEKGERTGLVNHCFIIDPQTGKNFSCEKAGGL